MPTPPIAVVPSSDSDAGRVLARAAIVALLLALLALQLRLWTGAASLAEIATLEARVLTQQAENRRLAEQNALLESEVRSLKEDPDSLEARARSELGMIREGETFFMVLPPARAAGGTLP